MRAGHRTPHPQPLAGRFCALAADRAAALAAAGWVGLGREEEGDQAAVDAMPAGHHRISPVQARVVMGKEKDKAPMLYNGEELGTGEGLRFDLAVDPIEGTRLVAEAGWGHQRDCRCRRGLFNLTQLLRGQAGGGPRVRRPLTFRLAGGTCAEAAGATNAEVTVLKCWIAPAPGTPPHT